jgi:tetratricopeptide (TPR) repeat protein
VDEPPDDEGGDARDHVTKPLRPRVGPYRLLRELGSGAMGSVHLAECTEDLRHAPRGTLVALKLIRPDRLQASGAFLRLQREVESGKNIRHPGLVRTLDMGTALLGLSQQHFIVMELVEGSDLRKVLAKDGPRQEPLVRAIGAQVAWALHALHEARVVHRDVKPGNILVTPEHVVKLTDFGIVHMLDAPHPLTEPGEFFGTPPYAAPEQLARREIGPPTDLYALGLVLLEASTGTQPFIGKDRIHSAADGGAAPLARELNPVVSPFLEVLIAELLEQEPTRRLGPAELVARILTEGEASDWWRNHLAGDVAGDLPPRRPGIRVTDPVRMVGRLAELRAMEAAFAAAASGAGRVVLMHGESGSGKTRLLAELVTRIAHRHPAARTMYGAFAPGGSGPSALAQALIGQVGDRRLAGAARSLVPSEPGLATRLAAWLGSAPMDESDSGQAQAVQAALVVAARTLARSGPVAWLVDDAHLATAEQRSQIVALAGAIESDRILLVIAGQPPIPEQDWRRLEAIVPIEQLVIRPLSEDEVALLVAEIVPDDALGHRLARRIANLTSGTPSFVLEVARELKRRVAVRAAAGEPAVARGGDALDVPARLQDLLLTRLDALPERERVLVEVGAVQGVEFDADLIARVLRLQRLEVLQALGPIVRRGGLIHAKGRGYVFDHRILREAIVAKLAPALRVEYHSLLARACAERERTFDRDDADVAGDVAVFLAEHFLRGGDETSGRRWALRAVDHLIATHRGEAAVDLAELAIDAAREVDPALACDLRLLQERALDVAGRLAERREVLMDALRLAESLDDDARASQAMGSLGAALFLAAEHEKAREVLEAARLRARRTGDPRTQARIHFNLGRVLEALGRPEEGFPLLQAAREAYEMIGDVRSAARTMAAFGFFDHEHAVEWHRRARDLARDAGDARTEAQANANLGHAEHARGRLDEASRCMEQALEGFHRIGFRVGEANAAGNLALLWLDRGETDRAEPLLHLQARLARETDHAVGRCAAAAGAGLLARARGDLGSAHRHLASAHDLAHGPAGRPMAAEASTELARVALEIGRPVDARVLITSALPRTGTKDASVRILVLARAAEIAHASGDLDAARAHLEEAAALCASSGAMLHDATLKSALGALLARLGDGAGARPLLESAAATCERLGLVDPGPLPAAWLALLGARSPDSVKVDARVPVPVRIAAHVVLHWAHAKGAHFAEAAALVDQVEISLAPEDRDAFWRFSPLARLVDPARGGP